MKKHSTKEGVSLIEVIIAMAVTMTLSGGLYKMGLSLQRSSETSRIATEAQGYARDTLESLIGRSLRDVAAPAFFHNFPKKRESSTGAIMTRKVDVFWHNADGEHVKAPDHDGFAEVHVEVTYPAPKTGKPLTLSYATLINQTARKTK